MNNLNWRSAIIQALHSIYEKEDLTHGLDHAIKVEKLVIDIANRAEYSSRNINILALRAAALLHDTGYLHSSESWSLGKVEHIRESVIIAQRILANILPFSEDRLMLQIVCYLILHHDDTNYSYPIQKNGYGTVSKPQIYMDLFDWSDLDKINSDTLTTMKLVLREADSLSGTDEKGAQRTWNYSLERSLSPIANGSPLNAWVWEESAIGNVRLAAKRALIDSQTREGRIAAYKGYHKAEEFISRFCNRNSIPYEPEPLFKNIAMDTIHFESTDECKLSCYDNWSSLENMLRRVPLHGDPTLFPYASAHIECQFLPIERLSPLSYYVLKSQVDLHVDIYKALLKNFALDVFNLSGVVEFRLNNKHIRLSPPIVECYKENMGEITGNIIALVDGLHRCFVAKQLGLTHIRVIVISGIAPHFPLVPLPLRWPDIKLVNEVPKLHEKRKYRFSNIQDLQTFFEKFPVVYDNSPHPPNDNEAKYYTYRDFSSLGSHGIRLSKEEIGSIISVPKEKS